MGNNIDFPYLFNLPEIKCPKCKRSFTSQLEEWDIDCGTVFKDGKYKFEIICDECNKEFTMEVIVNAKVFVNGKEVKTEPKCGECGREMETEDEIKFGQCDHCCAWKYRDNCK